MSQMSNLLSKLDNESKGIGLTIEGFLEERKSLSKASHKSAKSSLVEIEGYVLSQKDTLTSLLEGLVQQNNEKKNLAPIIKALLSGLEKYSSKTRFCNNCDGKGFVKQTKIYRKNGKSKSVNRDTKCSASQ